MLCFACNKEPENFNLLENQTTDLRSSKESLKIKIQKDKDYKIWKKLVKNDIKNISFDRFNFSKVNKEILDQNLKSAQNSGEIITVLECAGIKDAKNYLISFTQIRHYKNVLFKRYPQLKSLNIEDKKYVLDISHGSLETNINEIIKFKLKTK